MGTGASFRISFGFDWREYMSFRLKCKKKNSILKNYFYKYTNKLKLLYTKFDCGMVLFADEFGFKGASIQCRKGIKGNKYRYMKKYTVIKKTAAFGWTRPLRCGQRRKFIL